MTVEDRVTTPCRSGDHQFCPGWFREDVLHPEVSNALCACPCPHEGFLAARPQPEAPAPGG